MECFSENLQVFWLSTHQIQVSCIWFQHEVVSLSLCKKIIYRTYREKCHYCFQSAATEGTTGLSLSEKLFNRTEMADYQCKSYCNLKACLHGSGGPQVGEVTRLAEVDKKLTFTFNLTTLGCRGKVSRGCYRTCN